MLLHPLGVTDRGVEPRRAVLEPLGAPQLKAKGLTFAVAAVVRPAPVARADREKVRQVLLNLLSNAVKFTEPGGRIDVVCAADGDRVWVRVRDTGIGIAPSELERVFEPFVQVNASLTRTQEGTGLGLAISRDLARGMGGDLTAESELGRGSAFALSAPRLTRLGGRVDVAAARIQACERPPFVLPCLQFTTSACRSSRAPDRTACSGVWSRGGGSTACTAGATRGAPPRASRWRGHRADDRAGEARDLMHAH